MFHMPCDLCVVHVTCGGCQSAPACLRIVDSRFTYDATADFLSICNRICSTWCNPTCPNDSSAFVALLLLQAVDDRDQQGAAK